MKLLNEFQRRIGSVAINKLGWHTKRKIIVFESDDWGSIRMRSKSDFQFFMKEGFEVNKCPYNSNDSLESNDDVEGLLNVLRKHTNQLGKNPIFTLNNVVANPDFDKIRKSNFSCYHFEPFFKTLERYPNSDKVMSLYYEGLDQGLFQPQFHGREHLNVSRWLNALNHGNKDVRMSFDREMFTVHKNGVLSPRVEFLDAFGFMANTKSEGLEEIVEDGLNLFKEIWGMESKSFIAPTFVWPKSLETSLFNRGVKYMQGTHVQRVPIYNGKKTIKKKYHYLGQRNALGQTYMVRNVFFEPVSNPSVDWVSKSLREIEIAFKNDKPAIISSHRVNYIGRINSTNRTKGLNLLDKLLRQIIAKYPDVEFMSTDELGDEISHGF